MEKIFYSIEINGNGIPATVYIANNCNYSIYFESRFSFDQGLHDVLLVSLDKTHEKDFERVMNSSQFSYKREKLESEYNDWLKKKTKSKEKLDDSFFDEKIITIIKEFNVPAIIELDNGSQLLTEKDVKRTDKITLYVHSDEQTHHNVPHVHVKYGGDKNYCSISLVDFAVLAPKNYKSAKVNEAIELLKQVIDKARFAWNNNTNSIIKFQIDSSGKPLNSTYKMK